MLTIKIIPNEDTIRTAGKVADAELHFTDGPLAGLKLIGFGVWTKRTTYRPDSDDLRFNITFPARQYNVNGERRSFALLRPLDVPGLAGKAALDRLIVQAYEQHASGISGCSCGLAGQVCLVHQACGALSGASSCDRSAGHDGPHGCNDPRGGRASWRG